MSGDERLARSFGAEAHTYETGRPDYPIQAVDWLLQPVAGGERRIRVADVGAGTGKLTRVVQELGAEVVAIDPDPQMLATLRESVHAVPTLVGTAERMPLPDDSVDAVVLGQAWHWVDPTAAAAEAGRVLRPGGVLGLVWNLRDDDVDWVARMTAVMHGSHAEEVLAEGSPQVGEPFGELESAEWRWTRPMNRATFLAMARSRSYVITAPADERARIEAGLVGVLDDIGAIGDHVVDLPYVTRAFRALRR